MMVQAFVLIQSTLVEPPCGLSAGHIRRACRTRGLWPMVQWEITAWSEVFTGTGGTWIERV